MVFAVNKPFKSNSMKKINWIHPYTIENIHPGFSVDCVILTFHKKKLRVLLNKFSFSNYWQLPGGFMFNEESSDEAATRILSQRTGIAGIYLKQFHLFSHPQRTNMKQNAEYLQYSTSEGDSLSHEEKWFLNRFISLGYYALVKYDDVTLSATKHDLSKWFDIDDLPMLYSDHKHIIETALITIRSMLSLIPVGYELLPSKFTIGELRTVYEIFTGKTLDRRNFLRKALSSGKIIQLNETRNTSPYNPPILYTYNKDRIHFPPIAPDIF